jgi:hypothetical protein
MESHESPYDSDWFRQRAMDSLHRLGPHEWDYSDSLLLYMPSGVEQYESIQATDSPYFQMVTKPERDYLQSIAEKVAAALPQDFDYIDLGPGTEHKEQFFFDALRDQGKTFTYIPVDISEHYLSLAEKHATDQGIRTQPIQASFEEVADIMKHSSTPRFVNIGLTFSNYKPHVVLQMLKAIAGTNGYAFLNSHMRNRVDMAALQNIYAADAASMADEKLRLIGLDPATDTTPGTTTDDIRVWCTVLRPSREAMRKGIVAGDTLLIFESLRYTPEQLEEEIGNVFQEFQILDTGAPFVGAILKT